MSDSGPLRLAHRGDWRHHPENTLAAFRAALRSPACDGLEFDVRSSADGVPVVIHDATLERVQGLRDRVAALTAIELGDHGVPTLEAVLAIVPRSAFLDIELKEDVAGSVVPLVESARSDPPSATAISSFSPRAIAAVRNLRPGWDCWLNTEVLGQGSVALARELGCRAIAADWQSIDRRSMTIARDAGLDVVAWPVARRPTVARLARLGVLAVCLDRAALEP